MNWMCTILIFDSFILTYLRYDNTYFLSHTLMLFVVLLLTSPVSCLNRSSSSSAIYFIFCGLLLDLSS